MSNLSAVDLPILNSPVLTSSQADSLKTQSYAQALAKFAMNCGTPMTIGVQGEWGSGKTSLLNMMQEEMDTSIVKTKGRSKDIEGRDAYKSVWINTWEHSLLKSPEECLISIVEEIIEVIAEVDGSWRTAHKAKTALSNIARGAFRVGASVALGSKAGEVADELMDRKSNSVKELRQALQNSISELVAREENPVQRFIVYIDDLDRLEPKVAVMVLELLKNIFNIECCVFVVAIDYQVVVKGLKDKFGTPSEDNEWEFRAFFDKIIQLPFMMPMAAYDLDNYLSNLLVDISYFSKSEMKILRESKLTDVVKLTIGANPRALKRLVNSLSLILLQREISPNKKDADIEKNEWILKQLFFVLVCFQISFPRIYELMIAAPLFFNWDDEFVNKRTGGPHLENKELSNVLNRAMEINEQDFDEDWEQALFKIVWLKNWQKNRMLEASRVLSLIKDKILTAIPSDRIKEMVLIEGLRLSAVTAVASTEDNVFGKHADEDAESDSSINKIRYWQTLKHKMKNSDCCFKNAEMKPTYQSNYWGVRSNRKLPVWVKFVTGLTSSVVLRVEAQSPETDESYRFFTWMKKYSNELEKIAKSKPVFKLSEERSQQIIQFGPVEGVMPRIPLHDPQREAEALAVMEWLVEHTHQLEDLFSSAFVNFEAQTSLDGEA